MSKSKVVNIGKKSNKDKRWQVGEGQVREGDDYCLEIKEQEEYKYLGIWFSGIKGIFLSSDFFNFWICYTLWDKTKGNLKINWLFGRFLLLETIL